MEAKKFILRLLTGGDKPKPNRQQERDYKAQMLFELVPQFYLNGTFPAVPAIEVFLNQIEAETGLLNKVLLARALDRGSDNLTHLGATSDSMGRGEIFSRVVKASQQDKPIIVINRDHPALDFSLQQLNKEGGFPIDPAVALVLFESIVAVQAELEKTVKD